MNTSSEEKMIRQRQHQHQQHQCQSIPHDKNGRGIKKKKRNGFVFLAFVIVIIMIIFLYAFAYNIINKDYIWEPSIPTTSSNQRDGQQEQIVVSSLLVSNPMQQLNFTLLEMTLLSEMNVQKEKNTNENSSDSPFQNCAATSNVEISNVGSTSWILHSLTQNDAKKTVGGDEFYITYTDNNAINTNSNKYTNSTDDNERIPTAVAFITDLNDGTYELNFKTTPFNDHPSNLSGTGTGLLVINLVFTCGIGNIPFPVKTNWTSSGKSNQNFTIENVPQPQLQYFTPPILPNLSKYKKVIFFGDSVIRDMISGDGESVPPARKKYFKPNVLFKKSVRSSLSLDTVNHFQNHLLKKHGLDVVQNHGNVSLVMGSSVWDLAIPKNAKDTPGFLAQGSDFNNHILACRTFIEFVRKTFPYLKIYWKLPSAMHQHLIKCADVEDPRFRDWCKISTKYMSSSRVEILYRKQKALMQELNVTYLDLYEASHLSAHNYLSKDGRHTLASWNRDVLEWFYPAN
jgi:hypothetical protein